MKNLILIRHAKSSWETAQIDKNRPLSGRGILDAHLVATAVQKWIPKTNLIWSSTAKRASETATIFAQNLQWPLESIIYKDELYTFDVHELEKIIKNCGDGYENVIIFGHNEAITDFVNKFGSSKVANVATSGFVSITFPIASWNDLKTGTTQKILFPKELKI
jgi:phosphohistidine phosphatase